MNDTLSFRDVERLSAYLDGQLSRGETARLEARLAADPRLRAALEDLRQARAFLHRAPQRRAPRNFTLTPRMAGLRPPVPRGVPLLSWASALAALLFFCTFSGSLVSRLGLNSAAPAAAPLPIMGGGYGGGLAEAEEVTPEVAPMLAAPAGQEETADSSRLVEATPETQIGEAEAPAGERMAVAEEPAASPQAKRAPITLWPLAWLVLAALLGGAALLLRWISQRRFRRKHLR